MGRRWLFADQLGPHVLDDPEQRVLLVVSKAAFRRRRYHRQKAHLVLSAVRHRAAELGDRAEPGRGGAGTATPWPASSSRCATPRAGRPAISSGPCRT